MSQQIALALLVALALTSAAVLAVGAMLAIKIVRRRQASTDGSDGRLDTGVAATPISAQHAARLLRRYRLAAGLVLALVSVASAVVMLWN